MKPKNFIIPVVLTIVSLIIYFFRAPIVRPELLIIAIMVYVAAWIWLVIATVRDTDGQWIPNALFFVVPALIGFATEALM